MLEPAQISDSTPDAASRWRILAGPALGLLSAGIICLCFCGWSFWRFGHPLDGVALLKGVVVKAENRTLDLGSVAPGSEVEAVFRLKNLTTSSVRVVGLKSDCDCIVGSELPMTIGPLSSVPFRMRFTPGQGKPDQELTRCVLLHLNVDAPAVVLTLTARLSTGD